MFEPPVVKPPVIEPPDLDKAKKRYPVVIPCVKRVSDQVRRVMKGKGLKM